MMKKITILADESLIQRASRLATLENKTLDELFQEWLDHYVAQSSTGETYLTLMNSLSHVQVGQMAGRDEMNERR